MKHPLRYILMAVVMSAVLCRPATAVHSPAPILLAVDPKAQTLTPIMDSASELVSRMSAEERIGQLFLTTFSGADATPGSEVARLISEHHIGGVALLAVSKNFINDETTPLQVATLTRELQSRAMSSPTGIPVFVAVDHEGDGFPYSRLTGGLTPIPNPMAIGATWDTSNAQAVGEIVGRELAAMGINMLLGPDVDVLNSPRPQGRGDIGTRTFGGDPWWVSQMGRAYVCGVHSGSGGLVATVAKHFPGHGGSDRLPDKEVATVDKSLTELQRIELPPFFSVTQSESEGDCAVTDAMMTSHIRYRGLQGNIRQFTAPISFDAEGLGSILGLREFSAWRSTGLMVSDALGVSAVSRYFDATEQTFPHRQIAKEALMAGNDLLIISEFARPRTSAGQLANLVDTILYFRDEYQVNPLFRARVDDAVRRIIHAKMRLYGEAFDSALILPDPEAAIAASGNGDAVVERIAREALTLLAPSDAILPDAPRRDEDLLIFTDSQPVSDCLGPECAIYEPLATRGVEEIILRLYGPEGSGQVDPERIRSYSFSQLKTYLEARVSEEASPGGSSPDAPYAEFAELGSRLSEAEWIVFAMRNVDRDTSSDAVRVFLDNGVAQVYKARLVVLAFNAPYYLDTTEINKLSLYLAAYSKMPPFIEAAVRSLFRELPAASHSPVTVDGINYDLIHQLSPDPARPFVLEATPVEGQESHVVPVGMALRAGPILDRNGNTVPGGTEVRFAVSYDNGAVYLPAVSAPVVGGIAEARITVTQPGAITISARSGDAVQMRQINMTLVSPPTATQVASPTSPATTTPSPTADASPTGAPRPATTPEPAAAEAPAPGAGQGASPDSHRLLTLLFGALGTAVGILLASAVVGGRTSGPMRLRATLMGVMTGMAAYLLYVVWLPFGWSFTWGAGIASMLAGIMGVFAAGAKGRGDSRGGAARMG